MLCQNIRFQSSCVITNPLTQARFFASPLFLKWRMTLHGSNWTGDPRFKFLRSENSDRLKWVWAALIITSVRIPTAGSNAVAQFLSHAWIIFWSHKSVLPRAQTELCFWKKKKKYSLLRRELIDSLPVGVVLVLVSQGPLLLFPSWLKATGCCPELPRRQSKTNKGEKVLGCRHPGINTETYTDMHTPVETPVNKGEFDIVCTHLLAKTVKLCTCVCAVLLLPLTRAHNGLF